MRSRVLSVALALAFIACDSPTTPPPVEDDGGPVVLDSGPPPDCTATEADFPAPVAGRCHARVQPGATARAGETEGGGTILPGGERVLHVGRNVRIGGFPMRLVAIPGTDFVVMSDGGLRREVLAVIDTTTLEVVSRVDFPYDSSSALFLGLAVSADGTRLWASGGGTDRILAYDLDVTTGALTASAARTIDVMPAGESIAYVSGLALTPTGDLVAAMLFDDALVVYDTATRAERRRIALPDGGRPYDVVLTPDGAQAFVSLWGGGAVVAVDLATGVASAPIDVGKNPQGLALSPDGRTLAVACSDSDLVAFVDVTTRMVTERFYVIGESASRGASPTALRYDAGGRLYVVDALENAIDVLERGASGTRRIGRVPTLWHPTDVLPRADGSLVFANGRHLGTGANPTPGTTDITDLMGGSVSVLGAGEYDDAQLAIWESEVMLGNTRMRDFTDVECDAGADYDFPIPRPGMGASTRIRHVILIVRENKTHDAYLGDLTDADGMPHGEGDPTLTLLPPAEMDQVIPNTRELARTFAMADNYYSHAEQSVQGHIWTTMGRTTDFVERSWLTTWGRGFWGVPPQGVGYPIGYPEEGSGFAFLGSNGVTVSNYGEIVGSRGYAPRPGYPGLVYNYLPDIDKGNWVADQIGVCNFSSFTYIVMPNDHTRGRDPGAQTPRSMIADNDEGMARVIEGLGHSTYWPESVVFVIEDDPQDGGDHIDNHRAPFLVVSPWARRGYVSSVHVSEASIWRTIQLIFGLSERAHSTEWDDASPLYDFFTSTPDYTPYTRIPRRWPLETNPDDRSFDALLSADFDWSRPDEQPGLSRLLWRHFRGTPAPWPEAPDAPGAGDEDD